MTYELKYEPPEYCDEPAGFFRDKCGDWFTVRVSKHSRSDPAPCSGCGKELEKLGNFDGVDIFCFDCMGKERSKVAQFEPKDKSE